MPNIELFVGAIAVVDHHALELNRRALDADLKRSEPPVVATYLDPVVINVPIHVCLTQINPAALGLERPAETR